MSTESLGTARLDLIVDTSSFEVAITRAKTLTSGFGDEAQRAFDQTTGKVRTATTSMLRWAEGIGRTADEQKLLNAAMRGVPTAVLDEIRKKLLVNREAMQATATAARDLAAAEELMGVKAKHASDGVEFGRMADEAERLRRGAQAVAVFTEHLDLLDIKTKHAADGVEFARLASEAERLRRGAQAVAVFTEQLDLLDIKAQHAADGADFKRLAADAERLRRGAQSVEVFTAELDRLAAAEAHVASQTAFVSHLQSQAVAIGKTRAELLELKAAELGVTQAAAPFIAQLKAQENALYGTATKLDKYGLSAKQTAAALRGVPAQVTDIFVSLQGGQAPLTILLQQGGQLKDMFGGLAPAARALGGAILGLVNPYTVLAATLGAVALAAFQGEKETNNYAKALATTGNQAGVTVGQLQGMAVAIRDNNTTQAQAAVALAAVAKSGKFTADQFGVVADAAVEMERVTGQAIDKTIEQFAELAKDPVAAVAKLNAETHFLTNVVYDQIKALSEQGDAQGAATLAMESYADAVQQRTADVEANLGVLQTAWRNLGIGAKWAWDQMLDVGREGGVSGKIAGIAEDITKLKESNFAFMQFGAVGSDARIKEIARKKAELGQLLRKERDDNRAAYTKAAGQSANDYAIAQDQEILKHSSSDKKREMAIRRSRGEADAAIKKATIAGNLDLVATIRANQTKLEAALNAEGAKKPKSGAAAARALANAEAGAELQGFKDTLKEEQAAIADHSKILAAEYSAKLVSAESYYAQTRELLLRDTASQEAALVGQISFLKQRNVAGKDSVNVQKEIGKLEAELAKVRMEGATAAAVLSIQEKAMAGDRKRAIDEYRYALDQTNLALENQVNAQILAIGMGQKEAQQVAQLAAVQKDYADKLHDLEIARAEAGADGAVLYDQKIADLKVFTDAQVAIVKDGYVRMTAAQGNWLNGVQAGVQNWADNTSNVASQMEAMTTRSMDGIADALTNAALTGKLQWKQMLIEMLKELTKFLIKQALLKIAYSFASSMGGSSGGTTGGTYSGTSGTGGYAKGGVFANSPSLSAYSGGVYNKPTPFMFAKGAGVFGEAGPEAIMPLTRGSDGKLGVKASGGGGVVVNVNTTINSDGSSSSSSSSEGESALAFQQFANRMRTIAQEEVTKSMRDGGTLWRAGVASR